jgi:hypothetical protein
MKQKYFVSTIVKYSLDVYHNRKMRQNVVLSKMFVNRIALVLPIAFHIFVHIKGVKEMKYKSAYML